ncbi:hypothetical protein BWX42_09430 [Dolosigranulum pigrum]|uniref:Gram-positive cocci surface proteins LPxTG domain-containing protein n=1 Tax=Dolosigranulum pigrum TaxID=29394 RepID=A0A1S8KQW1_9LACT|nr:hypothetical protein [Dolosigranulum pigrum]OOL81885.1 hypothetical protein BWX42_09430 [Dolosigranulum pigrum]QTJ49501.1 hypothetical protein FE331_02130 [Dolosigranulum pigrum]VTU65609.1 hypothetical protein AMBR_FBHANALA_00678 [Dolosigranulum pigrum]
MNKYSQLLKKLGLSAAALALSATLAVDSASAADENATDETVEQNVEADTTTEEKTEVLSEEKATEATTEKAVEEKAPEATQPEQTDRLLGRTPVPHVNYDHAYFTHRTSDTVGTIFHRIILSFYINGVEQSGDYIQIYSKPNTYGLTYDQLRDKVESRINQYQELGYELVQLDDSPYDNYYNYYFVDADKLSTDGETPEKPATDKQAEQKPAAPAKEEQKPEAKPEEQKPAADKKEESFDDLRPLEELPLGGHASSFDKNGFPINWSEAKKQAYIEKFGLPKGAKEAGKKDSARKAKANQHDSKWGAFGTEENATRYAVGEFYGNGFKELTNLTQAQRGEIEERLGAAKTMAEFEAIVADAKRMNSGQPQSNQAQSGQAQAQQQDAQKQEARGERLPDTATGAWALGAVGLSTILAGLGVKKFKKD